MPVAPTYPGVYIEEIPSGVRTITGVATSITAFIGRALRGPVDEPVTINSFGDFERVFGGLWIESTLGYAVRDFYLNGGSHALVVRLFHPIFASDDARADALDAANDVANAAASAAGAAGATSASVATAARAEANASANAAEPRRTSASTVAGAAEVEADQDGSTPESVRDAAAETIGRAAPITTARLTIDTLSLEAENPGAWGNRLQARVDHETRAPDPDRGEAADSLFNLSIRDRQTGQVEVFRNVTAVPGHPRQIDRVLINGQSLVRVRGTLPSARPTASSDPPLSTDDVWGEHSVPTNARVEEADSASDGGLLSANDFIGEGLFDAKRGLYALRKADLFNLLCIPPYLPTDDVDVTVISAAATYCEQSRAMLLVDAPSDWSSVAAAVSDAGDVVANVGTNSKNAALFFPRLRQPNPLRENQIEDFASCGAVAGIFARTDTQRGVWKAPAGLEATLVGVPQLSVPLTDLENGQLNPLGINCLRSMPAAGRVVWGSRTLQGNDRLASEWKYIPVRRLALFIEETLYRSTQWVVFEPNDEPLWSQIRLNIGAFMQGLFRQGAFQGKTPREAYFVKCDRETTTQTDINSGIVNIVVGFAPLKPAEFVIIKIQQMAGDIPT